jgi:hypothetical protein
MSCPAGPHHEAVAARCGLGYAPIVVRNAFGYAARAATNASYSCCDCAGNRTHSE